MTKHNLPWKARTGAYARYMYFLQQGYTRDDAVAMVQEEIADGSLDRRRQGTPVCVRLREMHELARARGKAA